MSSNKLPKALRICGKKRVDRLFESGTSGFCHPFRYVFLVCGQAAGQPEVAAGEPAGIAPDADTVETLASEGVVMPDVKSSSEHPPLPVEGLSFFEEGRVAVLVSVPKRNHKRAVRRNLLKRRTRESFRTRKHAISEMAAAKGIALDIALLYAAKEAHDFNTIDNAVARILEDISQRL